MLVFPTPTSIVHNVVDLLKVMSQIWHTSNKLKCLDYVTMIVEAVNLLLMKYDGDMLFEFPLVCNTPPPSCIIACKICGSFVMCVQTCICHIYYVVHSLSDLLRVAIHLRTHEHIIFEEKCRKSLKEMKSMVIEEVLCMPNATSSTISLVVSTMFLSRHLFNKDGASKRWKIQSSHVNVPSFVFS